MTNAEPRPVIEVEMAPTEQGIVVFDGSGMPLHLMDSMGRSDLAELLTESVTRRVLAARLRAWADIVDSIVAAE